MARKKDCGDRICRLYRVIRKETGDDYIGVSIDIRRRWREHRTSVKEGSETHFHRALRLYGEDAFTWKVIAIYRNEDIAREMEFIAITMMNMGAYNMTPGGDGISEYTQELRDKVSERTREAMARPEVKAKLSAAMEARWRDPVQRDRMTRIAADRWLDPTKRAEMTRLITEAMNRPEVRAHHAASFAEAMKRPEVKAKMCASQKAKWDRPGIREAHQQATLAGVSTPEAKANMSAAQISRFERTGGDSEETKEKKRQAQLTRFEDPEERTKLGIAISASFTPERRAAMTVASTERYHGDEEFRNKLVRAATEYMNRPEVKHQRSEAAKEMWADPIKKTEILTKILKVKAENRANGTTVVTSEQRQAMSERGIAQFQDPSAREAARQKSQANWDDPTKRQVMLGKRAATEAAQGTGREWSPARRAAHEAKGKTWAPERRAAHEAKKAAKPLPSLPPQNSIK